MSRDVKLNVRLAMMLESLDNEDASGKATQEVEHVFYGKIADANQLAELAKQPYVTKFLQEQSQCKILIKSMADNPPTLRVRRINGESCVITRKVFVPGQAGMMEDTKECGEALYDFLAQTFGEAMTKMRYVIQPEGQKKLELDVFLDRHGSALGFAKIDFEVESADEACPPLPLTLTELKHVDPYKGSDVDRAALRDFMQMMTYKTV